MYKLKQLSPSDILNDGKALALALGKAMSHCEVPGWTGADVVLASLQDPQHFHLWTITGEDGNVVAYSATRTFLYPQQTTLCITALANAEGDPSSWSEYSFLLDELEAMATEQGIDKIEVCGRRSWGKLLKPMGYNLDYVVLSKDLRGE